MPEEQVTTPQAAEPETPATPPAEEPKAEQPTPEEPKQQEPDFRAAYVGLQRTINKSQRRNEDLLRQNAELADALRAMQETQSLIAKQTLGEDQVKDLTSRQQQQQERAAALRAAQTLDQSLKAAVLTLDRMMETAGLSKDDRMSVYAEAKEYDGEQWFEAVYSLASQRAGKALEDRVRKAEEGIKAKSKKEAEAEAEAIAQRQLKEAGVDKVDTASGTTSTSSLAERIKKMKPGSEEFAKFYGDVLAGRVNTKR